MRAPQPVEKAKENIRFIFREDKVLKGIFDEVVSTVANGSKWEVMKQAISSSGFVNLQNESAVEKLNPALYNFGVWIARNRSDYDAREFEKIRSNVTPLEINTENYAKLWNNLFFQVVTEKDFYTKEAIIQMLVANHVATYATDANQETIDDLMNAKVVLPSELFLEAPVVATVAAKKVGDDIETTYPSIQMQQLQAIAQANLDIQSYQILLKELKIVEKRYKKEYDAEYKKQEEVYNATYKLLWNEYYDALQNAKKNWCAIRDPKIPFDSNHPCDQPAFVPEPDVPAFVFDFRDELDLSFLRKSLTEQSFGTVMRLLSTTTTIESAKIDDEHLSTPIDDFEGFNDLTTAITADITTAQNTIYTNTEVVTPSYTRFGGVLIPNYQSIGNNPFRFTICANKIITGTLFNLVNFIVTIDVPDNSWQAIRIDCLCNSIPFGGTTPQSMAPLTSTLMSYPVHNQISIVDVNNLVMSEYSFLNATLFTVEVTFANKCKKSFTLTDFNTISCKQGTMTGDCGQDNSDTNGGNIVAPSFLPSGFGMKQIGIADYKIVEQSVHCYIAGEVAHIENIMARERREKSTKTTTKSEIIDTQKQEGERETNTDTASTTRYEMQSEVAQVIQDSKDFNASTQFSVQGTGWSVGGGMGLATHKSKEQNTRQAVTNAKEVTQKAAERITSRVTSERVEKIINEYEETNIHEFDNRKGDKHVVGVYRWVDKIYKNQIVNFGKRMLFEFMIPEPGKLHTLGMEVDGNSTVTTSQIPVPIDPRLYDLNKADTDLTNRNLKDFSKIKDNTLRFWAGHYNVECKPRPLDEIYIGKSMFIEKTSDRESVSKSDIIIIEDGYKAIAGKATISGHYDTDISQSHVISVVYGNVPFTITSQNFPNNETPPNYVKQTNLRGTMESGDYKAISGFKNEVPISLQYYNYHTGTVNFSIRCQLTDEAYQQWQQVCFKAIIDKYEEVKATFDKKMEGTGDEVTKTMETNPAFLRQMMNLILRKNCISYIINQDQAPTAKKTYGRDMSNGKTAFNNYEVLVNQDLDDYASFAKFIEQAFEWPIMSYSFYPYYWANRNNWKKMYQFPATDDALFNSFMQAGMGRVIVTVRPGYEEAVRYYMQTGRIWNGGEVPVIKDKLFLALIDELREPTGKKEGKAWATRLPTTMTILQANSIGLMVKQALPCNCDDITTFENPELLPCNDNSFVVTNAQMSSNVEVSNAKILGAIKGTGGVIVQIELLDLDGELISGTLCDSKGTWELTQIAEGNYQLLIDSTNKFSDTSYVVETGSKDQLVTLGKDQTLQIGLAVLKL